MTLAVRADAGLSRYVANEWDATFRSSMADIPLLWCHGNNGLVINDYTGYRAMFRALAQEHITMAADLGFNTFGNDLGITRTGQALDRLAAEGAHGPAVLVGGSMGALVAINYAVRYPERVAAVVGIIPALTLDAPPGHVAEAAVDAAYPPAYDVGNPDHLAHDPIHIAADLPADLPVILYYSPNDPTCPPDTNIDPFVAARPQTETVALEALGHGFFVGVVAALVEAWLKDLSLGYDEGPYYGAGPYGALPYGGT